MQVNDRTHRVRVDGEQVEVDGVPLTVIPTAGARLLVRGRDDHGQRVVSLDGAAFAGSASVGGVATTISVRTAQAAALGEALASGAGARAAGSQLKAPMPGRVVKVLIKVGEVVQRGAPIVIVEAMKMENEMHAPASGTVLKVHVVEGATVDAGQLLVELELG